jgi:hypothetical protein
MIVLNSVLSLHNLKNTKPVLDYTIGIQAMIFSPYETLACRSYNLDSVKKGLDLANVEDNFFFATLGKETIPGVLLLKPSDKETPLFAHPLIWNNGYGDFVVVDARGLIREKDDGYQVTQKTDYTFQVARAALILHSIDVGVTDIQNLGDIAATSFSRYIAENLTRRLGLSPEEQAIITMVSAIYYYCLFKDTNELTERDFDKMVQKSSRVTRLPANWIYDHMGETTFIADLNEFSRTLKAKLDSPRTKDLSPAVLISFLGGGWFGANGRENMAVALEHPQTFATMVYIALTDRSYRNAGVSKTVLLNDRNGAGKQFILNFERLLTNIGK